jgi:hypothetical protein
LWHGLHGCKSPKQLKAEKLVWKLVWEISRNEEINLLQATKNTLNAIVPLVESESLQDRRWLHPSKYGNSLPLHRILTSTEIDIPQATPNSGSEPTPGKYTIFACKNVPA